MKIEKFVNEDVEIDGALAFERGAVVVKGRAIMSTGEGCGSPGCHCSDGYWISFTLPRTSDGKVEGIIARFVDKREMDDFLKGHVMIPS